MRKLLCLMAGMVLLFHAAISQELQVSGKITDDYGNPVGGASIVEKATKNGTIAGADGSFTLKTKQGAILEISYLGFISRDVKVNGPTLAISLQSSTTALNEVVVTGVGVATSRKKLGIAVESVTADKLPKTINASVDQALVGKIAGAQISSINGSPGSPTNILLRGINTINRGTMPMILLDGIEVRATDLNSLDVNAIERIEVVQGAASATIYGAQGANGVIQLFSKKGKAGRINVDVSSSISSNTLLNIGDVHKSHFHSFATNANGEVIGSSGNPLSLDPDLVSYKENVLVNLIDPAANQNKPYDKNLLYYDHYKMFFQTSHTFNNAIAVSGGRDRVDFNISASDNRQNTNFVGNGDYSRSNMISNIGVEIVKNLRFRSITQLVYTKNTQLDPTGRTIVYALNNSRPFANYDYRDPMGNYGAYYGDAVGVNGYNPHYQNQYGKVDDKKIDIVQSFNLNYRFPKFVELDVKYGLNYQTQDIRNSIANQEDNVNADYQQYWLEYYAPFTSYGAPGTADATGEINEWRNRSTFQNFLSSATFRFDLKDDFGVNFPLKSITQVSYDYRKSLFTQYITYGVDAPSYLPYTASQMGSYKIQRDYQEPFNTYGYLVNQRFEIGDFAGVSGGFRSDYSSAFGRGSKPFTFPRADVYLRISQLNFWKDAPAINNIIPEFRVRAAYGEAGIQPNAFDRYITLNTRNMGTSVAFVYPTTLSNPDLSVEVSKEFEVGADLTFNVLKGDWLKTINLSVTYWDRKTENAIYPVDAAPSTGIGTIKDNAFGLGAKGIQATLSAQILTSRNFTWNYLMNFSKQSSKITSLLGPPIVVISSAGSSNYILKPGEKIGQLYGYLGLHDVNQTNPNTGEPYIPKDQQGNYVLASNGWVANKDTKQPYFTPIQYNLGDPNPKFNISFINELTFKNFLNFSMQWDWIEGSHIYNQTKQWMYRDGIHGDYANPITINGQTGAWTAFYRGVYAQRQANGTKNYFYEDASFMRLRNLSVALDFARLFNIKVMQRLQLVLSGRNLVTFTKYTGYDPEVSSGTANSAFDRGVDHNTVPNLRSYQVGISLGF
ncbi:SusC/RagA family TonB-linked outer membrane protein [Pollutibacter soli]|uniref:SusC/RagA family TonB-linked outer membrane protein n=1 Tax=Pollutibacter soli TaxID=3034157 RepID=UPI00301383C3